MVWGFLGSYNIGDRMSSDNKKIFTTQATSKGAGDTVTSDVIEMPKGTSDHILSVKADSSCTGVVNVELEMSPDGTSWCPATTRTVSATATQVEPKVGNEEYVKLTPDAGEFKNKHCRGGLNFDVNGAVVTPDGTGARDLMHQHIGVNKSFNYSQWFKTSEAPTTTYKPVLFRHGGYDNFENLKAVELNSTSTQNLSVTQPVSNRYDGLISPLHTGTNSELSFDFLYALAPNKDWTWISLNDGVSNSSGSPNYGPFTYGATLSTISFRHSGPSFYGQYGTNRLYMSTGYSGYNVNSAAQTALGSMQSGNYFTVYPNNITGASISYVSPSEIDQALIMVATNSFNSSTNVATITLKCYNKQTGTLVATRVMTSNAMTADQMGFWDGTGTTNLSTLGFNTNTGYANYRPLTFRGAHNLVLSKHLPDQAAIDDYLVDSADGGIDIIQDTSGDSDVLAQYKMGNGANDSVSGTFITRNEAGATTAFPDFTMYTVRDVLGSTAAEDDGLATQVPALNNYFSTSSNLSISGWFKTTDTGVLFSNTEGAAASGMVLSVNASNMILNFIGGSQLTILSDVDDGEWHNIVVTKPSGASPTFKVYIDGSEAASNAISVSDANLAGNNGFTLLGDGQHNAHAASPSATDSSKLQASLSNWSIHSETLGPEAVKQIYSNGHVRNIKNLPDVAVNHIQGWWQLSDVTAPEQNAIDSSNTLQIQDANSQTLAQQVVNATGPTLVEDTINGNAMTLSLTKSFNFTTNEWVETADQESALCLSFNGFEEQAEHVALWKCSQTIAGSTIDICDGNWHNVILSYRGNNDLAGNNVAEGDVVKFGPGPAQSLPFNWAISFDGQPLTAIKDGSGADYIDGLGATVTDTYNSVSYNVGFNIYNRHMKYETSNTEEEYKPHAQFSAGIHEVTGVDNNNAFQGSVDETSFHSDCWWVDQAGTSVVTNTFNQEKPATIYGNTTALTDRGAGTEYPVGVPYPLLTPSEIGASSGSNQYINPEPKDASTNPNGGVEGWWRWGDTPGDCSVTINDVRDHQNSVATQTPINHRDIDAFGIVTADRVDMSTAVESIYNETIESGSATGSLNITFPQIVVSNIQAGICNLKQMTSPILKYLRVKFTGTGSCDLGS